MSAPEDELQFDLELAVEDPGRETTLPARVGRDEMNLAEFPFALLSDRAPKGLNTITFEDTIEAKDGKRITRTWTLTGGEAMGLPLASDEEVYVALMEVSKEQGFDNRTIYITRYDLIKRLGWPDKGDSYRRLRSALDRLLGVTIKAQKAFWDKAKQRYVDVGFHIIDDYALYDENPGRKSKGEKRKQDPLPLSFISWNQVIFRSFQAGNIKQLDTAFFFALKSSISRRLYRYLDKKRYDGKGSFRMRLKKLAFEKLGMSRKYYPSHIKQELKRAHDELLEYGFLDKVEYEKPNGGEEQVIYYFTQRKYMITRDLSDPGMGADLLQKLAKYGVTAAVAKRLVDEFGDEVRVQLQYLPYRGAQDPPAVLVEAIKGKWEPPASYLKARTDEQQRVEEDKRRSVRQKIQAEREAAIELQRTAVLLVFNNLPEDNQKEVLEEADERVAQRSPAVARHSQSRAFLAMRQEEIAYLMDLNYPDELLAARDQLLEEARIDLNDDL